MAELETPPVNDQSTAEDPSAVAATPLVCDEPRCHYCEGPETD